MGALGKFGEARVALGCASSYSYFFFLLSKLPACIQNSIYARLSMNKFLSSVYAWLLLGKFWYCTWLLSFGQM